MAAKKVQEVHEYEPNQLFRVRDRGGVEHVVGGAWLNRWPGDFEVIEETSDPESATVPSQGAGGTGEKQKEK